MKKYVTLSLITVLVGLILVGQVVTGQANSLTPGSADDPLVTKSYVDELLKKLNSNPAANLEEEMTKKLAEAEGKIDKLLAEANQDINDLVNKAGAQTGGGLLVIELYAGDVLKGKEGTELIARTGESLIVAGENGIPDVTSGVDLANGVKVPLNHLLITPRDDGRGIMANPASSPVVYVMVRGDYELVRATK